MSFKFLPLPQSEWLLYYRLCSQAFTPGIWDVMYPNGASESAIQHSLAALKRADARHPGRMHMFKVVDPSLPDSDPLQQIVGVSQWKLFPKPRSAEELALESELDDKDDEEFGSPEGLSAAFEEGFAAATGEYKKKILGGRAYVLLHVLATRPGYERRGVGATGLRWGTERADEMGLPAYLEASPKGAELYRRWGWEEVETLPFDARQYGYHESLTHLCMLRPAKAER